MTGITADTCNISWHSLYFSPKISYSFLILTGREQVKHILCHYALQHQKRFQRHFNGKTARRCLFKIFAFDKNSTEMLWCGIAHYCSEGNSNLLLLLGVSLSKTLLKRLPNQQSNLMNNSALKYSRLKNLKYDIQYLQFFNGNLGHWLKQTVRRKISDW